MPALALKDNNNNNWEPVGEENYFTTVMNHNGYLIAICDKNGIAKTVAQWFIEVRKDEIIKKLFKMKTFPSITGKVILPV